jgi:hypothetical protein
MNPAKEDALIFISWSGETSKGIALALRELLRNCIHTANPWMSESDLEKGARWRSEVEKKLEAAIAGIVVLTADNQSAPWLLFESGALSKKNERVYTYLYGLEKGYVAEPLGHFNHTSAGFDETLKMVKSINRQLENQAIEEERMVKAFRQNWPEFESKLKQMPESSVPARPVPTQAEMLQLAIIYLREQSDDLASLKKAVDGLTNSIGSLPPRPPKGLLETLGTYTASPSPHSPWTNIGPILGGDKPQAYVPSLKPPPGYVKDPE